MSLLAFTRMHVAISLIGILSGIVVVLGMIRSQRLDKVTALFLVTTVLTSLTGFFFPFHGVTPGIVLGVLSMVALLIAILARHTFHMAGAWRWVYVVCAVLALWFNVFVLFAQSFQKIPVLHANAAKGFPVTVGAGLVVFVVLGYYAVKKFHPLPALTA